MAPMWKQARVASRLTRYDGVDMLMSTYLVSLHRTIP